MPKVKEATPKQKKFVAELLSGPKNQMGKGNGTLAAMKAYNTKNENTAHAIASENLRKATVIQLLQDQAEESANDLVDIRAELKEAKKDYAVRAKVNFDILDRTGYKAKEEQPNQNINIAILNYGSPAEISIAAQLSAKAAPTGISAE